MPEVVLPEDNKTPISAPPENRELEMEVKDHIGIFKNAVPDHICDAVINTFEFWHKKKYIPKEAFHEEVLATDTNGQDVVATLNSGMDGTTQFANGQLGRKDTQLFLEVHDEASALTLAQWLGDCFQIYTKEYKGVTDGDPLSSWTYKIQKTPPGGGYHVWHCEDSTFLYRDRVLTWMIYLNDIPIENGGATEFLYQKLSLRPTKGTIVFWPAAYTHMHRGGFLTGDIDKYIATGWFNREAPNR